MNLIVDIGNSRVKLALTEGGEAVAQCAGPALDRALLGGFVAGRRVRRAIVCSTRGDVAEAAELVRTFVADCLVFTPDTPVPLRNAYLTPRTLGRDRLAAAVGAATLCPVRDVLIADFGTALTVDLVTADGTFRGGFIAPGLRSRFRALHEHTARLPLCAPDAADAADAAWSEPGLATEEAMRRGVLCGMLYEVEGHLSRMAARYAGLCIFFTGGDAKYFAKRIKNTIFANRNLVLSGLDRILEYNASEENPD